MNRIESLDLLTDLYELTMAASYFDHQMFEPATFSLFIRNYPPSRRYFVSAGLSDVFSHLHERYKSIYKEGKEYPVGLSPRLKSLQDQVVREAQDWIES